MEDNIDIVVTETTNLIEITSQPTDEIIDVNLIDNREDITLNVTPSVVEININSLTTDFTINWGEILGTLSDQTDLQTALNAKVSGSGTTNYIPKFTSSTTIGDSGLQTNSLGNLGLGISPISGGSTANWITADGSGYGGGLISSLSGVAKSYYYYDNGYSLIKGDTSVGAKIIVNNNITAASFETTGITTFNYNTYVANSGNALLRVHSLTNTTPIADIELMRGTNTTWGTDAYGDYRLRNSGGDFTIQFGDTGVTSTRFTISSIGDAIFTGSLGIGATSLTGYNLRVSKNITGATTSYGISVDGTIQSGVTTSAYYNRTNSNTQATTFTLGTLAHYIASQGTFGAGSTVTNQYGFLVDNSFTGATNNYGFYGNVSSGTNRWNLYMQGSANNYLAGSLGIGSTSPSGKLEVNLVGGAAYFTRVAGDNGTTNPALQIGTSTTSPRIYGYGSGLEFYTAAVGGTATIKMILNSSGTLVIGTSTVDTSALFQVDSTTKGFLPPRMTTTQKNAISSPATGLVVFDITLGKLCIFSTTWQTITSA